jgi:hypothetical protein
MKFDPDQTFDGRDLAYYQREGLIEDRDLIPRAPRPKPPAAGTDLPQFPDFKLRI